MAKKKSNKAHAKNKKNSYAKIKQANTNSKDYPVAQNYSQKEIKFTLAEYAKRGIEQKSEFFTIIPKINYSYEQIKKIEDIEQNEVIGKNNEEQESPQVQVNENDEQQDCEVDSIKDGVNQLQNIIMESKHENEDLVNKTPVNSQDTQQPQEEENSEQMKKENTYENEKNLEPKLDEKLEQYDENKVENDTKLRVILPVRSDSKSEILRKVITLTSAVVLVVSIVSMVTSTFSKKEDKEPKVVKNNPAEQFVPAGVVKGKSVPTDIQDSFEELYKTNDKTVGTISIDGTNIEQPIVQAKDNKYYKSHDYFNKESKDGTAFVDSNCKINPLGRNTVIYANNNKDESCVFSPLIKYEKLEAFKREPVFSFNTLYQNIRWKIYACFYTTNDAKDDNGYVFDYANQKLNAKNFKSFIKQIDRRKVYTTGVDINKDDKLLMISIPAYNDYFGVGAKKVDTNFVLVARKLRQGESEVVVSSKCRYNRRVYKPQVYFDNTGTKNYSKKLEKWNA